MTKRKKINVAIKVLLISIIVALTFQSFDGDFQEFIFFGGSHASTSQIVSPLFVITASSCILILIFLLFKKIKYRNFFLALSVAIWFDSGRTIGLDSSVDGMLVTGWFNIPFNDVRITTKKNNAHSSQMPFYYFNHDEDVLYLGFVNWKRCVTLLDK